MSLRRITAVVVMLSLASAVFAAGSSEGAATTKAPTTLTYWNEYGDSAITGGDSNKTFLAQELEKRSGVHIEWIAGAAGAGDEQLLLLLASKNVPDMIATGGFDGIYPGGIGQAAKDNVITALNPYIDQYAPNYKRAFTSRRELETLVKSDDGTIYTFARIYEDDGIGRFFGPMVRKDLLDKAGLAVPETMDEWYTVLSSYKKQGITNPLTFITWFLPYSQAFVGAYGVTTGMAVSPKGVPQYGPVQPGYKQYLETFRKWYAEGLIDPDYPTLQDWGLAQTKMTTNKSAACLGFLSFLNDYLPSGKQTDPGYSLAPAKYPVLTKGAAPYIGQNDPPATTTVFVGATGKHIPEAVKWLDYGYTDEGAMLYNFGIEGVTYEMKNGYPTYTNEILHNPKGWTVAQALSMYCDTGIGPWRQKKEYFEQIRLVNDAQKQAIGAWQSSVAVSAMDALTFTAEEQEIRKLLTDIETYVDETTLQFITGYKPMSEFDKYVETVKGMGIDKIVTVYNTAWQRFQKR